MENMKIYLINLDHRKDRLIESKKEFEKLNLPFERFNAIKNENGHLGCTLSHLKILKMAKEKNLDYVMVCEDDVEFHVNRNNLDNFIKNFIEDDNLKMFVPIHDIHNINSIKKYNDIFFTSDDIIRTTCYVVKKKYYDKLIKNFSISKKGLSLGLPSRSYALDQTWKILQKEDIFAIPNKLCGKQRASYSDIAGKYVDRKMTKSLNSAEKKEVDTKKINKSINKKNNILNLKEKKIQIVTAKLKLKEAYGDFRIAMKKYNNSSTTTNTTTNNKINQNINIKTNQNNNNTISGIIHRANLEKNKAKQKNLKKKKNKKEQELNEEKIEII
jgi:glycosyl transferase, family 25